jgi:hypothetical protein
VHVGVHRLDPAHEGGRIARELRLAHAVNAHPVLVGLGRQAAAPAGQHVHFDAVVDEALGELADVSAQAALDHRRVLPGDDEDAHADGGRAGTLLNEGAS